MSAGSPCGEATQPGWQHAPSSVFRVDAAPWLLLPPCTRESWHLTVPSAPPETKTDVLRGRMELTLLAWVLYGRIASLCRSIRRICAGSTHAQQ